MKATIIIIGDEILLGQVVDTNSGAITRILGPMGWQIVQTHVVGDDADAIRAAVKSGLSESDLVITTGGLGPTKDDITKHVLTQYFGGNLIFDQSVSNNIDKIFARRGLKLNDLTRNQALVPSTCRVIQNQYGTAPVMWFERDGKVLVSMPGVPFEAVGMMEGVVAEEIQRYFLPHDKIKHHTLIVSGLPESAVAERLAEWEDSLPERMHLAYLPQSGYLRLRLDATNVDDQEYDDALAQLKILVSDLLLYDGDVTPAEILLDLLRAKGYTLATAESCTGGNIAHNITMVPGCSDSFVGSVVSYSNSVKSHLLGVSDDDLTRYGAVSEPVVRAMAEGVARATGADASVATSGIAGPGGGTEEKPVGTVWIAAHCCGVSVSKCYRFPGDRSRVIDRATVEALMLLIRLIKG